MFNENSLLEDKTSTISLEKNHFLLDRGGGHAAAYPNRDVPIKVPGRWAVVASAGLAAGLTRGRRSAARKQDT